MKETRLVIPLIISTLIFGIFFELTPFLFSIVILIYILFLPHILQNKKKQSEEFHKFHDVNLYMSQMAQSFVYTKNILSSLRETAETFPSGKMQDMIDETIEIILMESGDISEAEHKALSYFEQTYGCEKLRRLHEFLLSAESQGGDCTAEFVILEKSRLAWETAISDYHKKLIYHRNTSCLLYCLMLGVCVFLLRAFPAELSIIQFSFVQITNAALLSLFILLFFIMDRNINGQLFKSPSVLSVEAAFPKWLFDILLLIQRQSVESAIIHSASTAPIVLQPELSRISALLLEHPGSIEAYTSFLSEHNIPQIDTTMRKLYAISAGLGQSQDATHFLLETNMDTLIAAERKNYETKGDLSSLSQFIPMLIATMGMLIYCVAIIFVTLSRIMRLFE